MLRFADSQGLGARILGFLDAQMLGFSDSEAPYAAQEMHSCCSGRIVCGREVIYAVYAAYGWGPRVELRCPGGGNYKCLGPTKQPNREPESRKARPQDNNLHLSRTSRQQPSPKQIAT